MSKINISLIILILLSSNILQAQDTTRSKLDFITPGVYFAFTAGAYEYFSLTLGIKDTDNLSYDVKYGGFGSVDAGSNFAGIGFGVNYYFKSMMVFRYSSFDAIVLLNNNAQSSYALQWVLGNGSNFEEGYGLIAELGIMYSSATMYGRDFVYKRRHFLSLVAKVGWNFNF